MVETVRTGGLEMRSFQTKDTTEGSLDLFAMTLLPGAHMPVPHHPQAGTRPCRAWKG